MNHSEQRKPDVVPSNIPYVSRAKNPEAGTVSVGTPEFCKYEGFTLRGLIANLWRVPESRIRLPASLEQGARFDVVLVPPDPESVEMEARMRDGLTAHFGLDVSFEEHEMDVLVLTAPNGIPDMGTTGGGLMSFCQSFAEGEPSDRVSLASPIELSVSGATTVDGIRDMLEYLQDRLVVDDSGTNGSFEIDIRVDGGVEDLMAALRETGIVTTPSRRDVRMLVVRRI